MSDTGQLVTDIGYNSPERMSEDLSKVNNFLKYVGSNFSPEMLQDTNFVKSVKALQARVSDTSEGTAISPLYPEYLAVLHYIDYAKQRGIDPEEAKRRILDQMSATNGRDNNDAWRMFGTQAQQEAAKINKYLATVPNLLPSER